jgi:hypothetical protein
MASDSIVELDYSKHVARLRALDPVLAEGLAGLRGLGGVMEWMRGRGLDLGSVEITNQDEFSLDFLVPLGPDGRTLVFGVT